MALITCSDCKAEISDAAVACPKCGRPVPVKKEASKDKRQDETGGERADSQNTEQPGEAKPDVLLGTIGHATRRWRGLPTTTRGAASIGVLVIALVSAWLLWGRPTPPPSPEALVYCEKVESLFGTSDQSKKAKEREECLQGQASREAKGDAKLPCHRACVEAATVTDGLMDCFKGCKDGTSGADAQKFKATQDATANVKLAAAAVPATITREWCDQLGTRVESRLAAQGRARHPGRDFSQLHDHVLNMIYKCREDVGKPVAPHWICRWDETLDTTGECDAMEHYDRCVAAEAKGDLITASSECSAAVSADPSSTSGKAAAQKRKEIEATKKTEQIARDEAACESHKWGTECQTSTRPETFENLGECIRITEDRHAHGVTCRTCKCM